MEILEPDAELWGIWDWRLASWTINGYGDRYQSLDRKIVEAVAEMANYRDENS